jgi:hypothetical protein
MTPTLKTIIAEYTDRFINFSAKNRGEAMEQQEQVAASLTALQQVLTRWQDLVKIEKLARKAACRTQAPIACSVKQFMRMFESIGDIDLAYCAAVAGDRGKRNSLSELVHTYPVFARTVQKELSAVTDVLTDGGQLTSLVDTILAHVGIEKRDSVGCFLAMQTILCTFHAAFCDTALGTAEPDNELERLYWQNLLLDARKLVSRSCKRFEAYRKATSIPHFRIGNPTHGSNLNKHRTLHSIRQSICTR